MRTFLNAHLGWTLGLLFIVGLFIFSTDAEARKRYGHTRGGVTVVAPYVAVHVGGVVQVRAPYTRVNVGHAYYPRHGHGRGVDVVAPYTRVRVRR